MLAFCFIFGSAVGLFLCEGFSLVEVSGGYPRVVMQWLLIAVASVVAEHGAQ